MDQREYVFDFEETMRTVFAGLQAGQWHAMPGILVEDSKDGHNATLQIPIKRMVTDPVTGERSYESHPIHPDTIVHFPGGARTVLTHGLAKGDEGLIVYANRDVDSWRQSGGEQQPASNRMTGYQDPHLIPGIRSDPRKLQQVDTQAAHLRSDDKLHVHEMHPDTGHRTFSADPSTAPASATFDPFTMASKFVDHAVQGAKGLLARAVTGGTTHDHGIDFSTGPFMRAANAIHSVLCHAQNGPSLNALNGLTQVLAHPALGALLSAAGGKNTVTATIGGVMLQSPTSISLSCPPGGLGLPSGGVGSSALAAGAASANVGPLTGDVTGTLPAVQVVGLAHVDAHLLPTATSDAAAAALSPPVPIGGLYRDTSIASGKSVLVVRMA